jgi:hypothetical protein
MPVGDPRSYQDVDWGYESRGRPETDSPVTLKRLQLVMNEAGFFLCMHDPKTGRLHWEHKSGRLITTLAPDFRADGHDDPVYEMAYVLDLLPKIAGALSSQEGDTGEGHNLIAKLKSIDNKPY